MDKKNIIIMVLLFLLAIVCFGIGLLSSDKSSPSKTKYDGEVKSFQTFDISDCSHAACKKEISFNGNTILITEDENFNYQIRYNKKVIASFSDLPYLGKNIYTFDDKILYLTYYSDYSALDNLYDPATGEVTSFDLSDDLQWYINDVEVDNGTIRIHTSRFDEPTNFIDVEAQIPVEMDNCDNYQKYAEKEVAKTYEIVYQNGSFSKAKEIETVLLKNYKDYSSLCN